MRPRSPRPVPRAAVLVAFVGLVASASTARADRLVAGGLTMEGSVKAISPAGVEFQPGFAKGPMLVPWDAVEDLSTEASYQVLHGDDHEVDAPIRAFRDGLLVVGDAEVDPSSMVSAVALADGAPGWGDRMRSQWRYWSGSFDLGFNMQQATNDNLGLMVGFATMRAKGPTRLMLGAAYRFATSDPPAGAEQTLQDSISASLRGEYDLSKRFYLYASTDVLYDSVQDLNLRAVPKAGVGYVVWQREPAEGVRDFLQVEAGGGWVYEDYMDFVDVNDLDGDLDVTERLPGDENDYFTVAFGASSAILLPYGAAFDWRLDWLPSVSDFTGDYVLRTQAGLTVPLIAPVSARFAVVDTYDSTPSPGADKNSLVFDTGLSLVW